MNGRTRHAYRADHAFDGTAPLPGGALVLVDDGRITAVAPARTAVPAGYSLTHLPGGTLLPGLVDAHTHLCCDGEPGALDRLPGLGPQQLDATVERSLAAQLAGGVTAVRDLGDHRWTVVDRHRDHPDGPTVVAAGPPITSPGGHCAALGGATRGVAGLRRAVRERAGRGAGVVKIMASGGVLTPHTDVRAAQFSRAELRAVTDEAHRHGLPVTAHAHGIGPIEDCVAAGVDGIEHCSCAGPDGMRTPPALAAAIAAAGIAVCPTLGHDFGRWGGQPPPEAVAAMRRTGASVEDRLRQVGELHRGGVTLVSGVDSGVHPVKGHGSLRQAVIELARSGVPTATALASATGLAADACRLGGRTGRLRPGLDADLVLVAGDATRDVTALRDLRAVVSRGRPVTPPPPPGPAHAR